MNELTHILNACCKITGIPLSSAIGVYQDRQLVTCRNLFFYFAKLKGYPFSQIGKVAKRDHSTVIHGIKNVKKFISINDHIYLNYISQIEKELNDNDINLTRLQHDIKLLSVDNLMKLRSNITDLIQSLRQ